MKKNVISGIVGVIAAAIVTICAVAATKPDRFHFERSVEIRADRATIAPMVTDLHEYQRWSPWAEMDPHMQTSYRGAASGTGAGYSWRGNDKVGRGEMDITGVRVGDSETVVDYRVHFIEPFESRALTRLTIADVGSGRSRVTWAMDSDTTFVFKVFDLIGDMDAMLSRDFERGMGKLARLVEH